MESNVEHWSINHKHSLNNLFLTVMEAFGLAGNSGLGSKWLNLPQITWNSVGGKVKW